MAGIVGQGVRRSRRARHQGTIMTMHRAAAFAALTALISGTASAQIQYDISNPSGNVRNFDIANMTPVLTELGVAWEQRTRDDGTPFLVGSVNGISFNFLPVACVGPSGSNCVGAITFALFSGAAANQQSINAFNQRYSFTTVGPLDTGGFYVSRYDIADFGIARGNVESSVDSFLNLVRTAAGELANSSTTVSTEGYADDLSAALLNEAAGRAIGVEVRAPQTHAGAQHLREIERLPDLIRAFAASGAAGVNRIESVKGD